jgi:site-specific recombinase XerD
LRGSRAVHLYKAGIDLESIQREGGWESIESLMKYLKMVGLESKQTLEMVKPNW